MKKEEEEEEVTYLLIKSMFGIFAPAIKIY